MNVRCRAPFITANPDARRSSALRPRYRRVKTCKDRREGSCLRLEPMQILQGVVAIHAAHRRRRSQTRTHRRPLGLAEQRAAVAIIELDARHAGRLAERHAGNRRGDRGRDAAGTAPGATGEFHALRNQSAVCSAADLARNATCTGSVSGRCPCQSSKATAACSISIPSPSKTCAAPPLRAHARNATAASP
jgi:hypothetical protein